MNTRWHARVPDSDVIAGACDCHMHVVGPFDRFPVRETRSYRPQPALLEDYQKTAFVLGLDRCVIVQPSCFGTDNECTLVSTERMNGNARAVVVFDPNATNADDIAAMDARGALALRIQLVVAGGLDLSMLEVAANLIRPFGWHLELCLDARQLPELQARLAGLDLDIVFDHMAHIDPASGVEEPGFKALLRMLDGGRTWVKLSNGFFRPDDERAGLLIERNRERVVWATDWPHMGFKEEAPDDGDLFDQLSGWTGGEELRRGILVDNPTALYFRRRWQTHTGASPNLIRRS
jgi:predicted TIM-barrel fold metal-dependent hydrolase